jgi:formate hydrogenlyase subunit 6/NADH:ubiquinone oxidoreductase subunit I
MNVDMTDNSRNRINGTECILCKECENNCPKGALHLNSLLSKLTRRA